MGRVPPHTLTDSHTWGGVQNFLVDYLNAKAKDVQLKAAEPQDRKAVARSEDALKVVILAINDDLQVDIPV